MSVITTLNYALDTNVSACTSVNGLHGAIEAIHEREAYAVANGVATRSYTILIEQGEPEVVVQTPVE